ncbi:MucBP domain-containing protein [Lactiplantibacillus daoliensis]|uniref:MucBP domain-containing protein n=1 Tax=Lactiplantibacillus daoliensis TaxID=2559916 RepID=A0ABW1UGG0_9LACO|nr:MucBP domain-containing protein [Lactiplantibacillus daoliensis]
MHRQNRKISKRQATQSYKLYKDGKKLVNALVMTGAAFSVVTFSQAVQGQADNSATPQADTSSIATATPATTNQTKTNSVTPVLRDATTGTRTVTTTVLDGDDNNKVISVTSEEMAIGAVIGTLMWQVNHMQEGYTTLGYDGPGKVVAGDGPMQITWTLHHEKKVISAKPIARIIHFNGAPQAIPDVKQSIMAKGSQDVVTGVTTYQLAFDDYDIPKVAGYSVSQDANAGTLTTATSLDDIVGNVTYTADSQTATINYLDGDTQNSLVTSKQVTGVTDGQLVAPTVPTNYEVGSSDLPATFGTSGGTYTVILHHKHVAGTQTVQRKINFTGVNLAPVIQTVQVPTDTDLVTGAVTYTATEMPSYHLPDVPGHVATSAVPAVTITAGQIEDMTVAYVPAKVQATVTVVDQITGKVIQTSDLNGKYGSSADTSQLKATLQAAGYQIVSDDSDGEMLGLASQFTIKVKHAIVTSTDTKTVKRTITYQFADGRQAGQAVTQSVTFERSKTVDRVTGEVTYGDWRIVADGQSQFTAVNTPTLAGYTANQQQVAAITVTGGMTDWTVPVIYQITTSKVVIQHVDENGQKIMPDTILTGDYGSNFAATAPSIRGYDVLGQRATVGTFGQDTAISWIYRVRPTTETTIQDDTLNAGNMEKQLAWQPNATVAGQQTKTTQLTSSDQLSANDGLTMVATKSTTRLPQTNDQANSGLVWLGLSLAGALGAFGIRRRQH